MKLIDRDMRYLHELGVRKKRMVVRRGVIILESMHADHCYR